MEQYNEDINEVMVVGEQRVSSPNWRKLTQALSEW